MARSMRRRATTVRPSKKLQRHLNEEKEGIAMTRKGDWIQTYTGRKFWPLDPRPEEVQIEDIAHALSMLCRFNGHTTEFYSVAEHSFHVSCLLSGEHALVGLLHDASEAYLSDVTRPVKPFLEGYMRIESDLMGAIAERFGFSWPPHGDVKRADTAMLATEANHLLRGGPQGWSWDWRSCVLSRELKPLPQSLAKELFMSRFKELTK
jgi:uncharacterized protein